MTNRQLHPTEAQKLAQLVEGKSKDEQYRLAAAECALVQCAAGVPDSDASKAALQQLQDAGRVTVATTSLDYSNAGFAQMLSGNVTSTYGEQVLQSLGLSPQAAALAYAGFNLGASVGASLANNPLQAATQTSDTSSAARVSNYFHRDDNLTTGTVSAGTINQQFIDQGYSAPFTSGSYVNVNTAGTGAAANMVVTSGQAAALASGKPAVGAFSTPDTVPNQQYVRSTLAVTPDMKPDVSMVQAVQTTGKTLVTVEGTIAPQVPATQFPGGGKQTFYDYPAGSTRTDYVAPVGPAQPLH